MLAGRFNFFIVSGCGRPCFFLLFGTVSLAFMGALYPSDVRLPWDGCSYCGAMVVVEPTRQPLRLLSELICAFVLGEKGGEAAHYEISNQSTH